MNWCLVAGARPQFIKLAPLIHALKKRGESFFLIHTGQHYDENMSELFFREMDIPAPHVNLGIGSLSHGAQTGRMIEQMEAVLLQENRSIVVLFGDTNSTLAGAVAASKLKIPIAHIEAGLRSFNFDMPEEQNRILTDHLSTFLFCPTQGAEIQLAREGIEDGKKYQGRYLSQRHVSVTGDIMADALYSFSARAADQNQKDKMKYEDEPFLLLTLHRAENTDDARRLKEIFSQLEDIPLPIILPLHPRTAKMLKKENIILSSRIYVTEPLGYLDMIRLERKARCIVTDSGGIQKEAYLLKVPCVTLRRETEWTETLSHGWNQLAYSAQGLQIAEALEKALCLDREKTLWPAYYGDGHAAERIIERVKSWGNASL